MTTAKPEISHFVLFFYDFIYYFFALDLLSIIVIRVLVFMVNNIGYSDYYFL